MITNLHDKPSQTLITNILIIITQTQNFRPPTKKHDANILQGTNVEWDHHPPPTFYEMK